MYTEENHVVTSVREFKSIIATANVTTDLKGEMDYNSNMFVYSLATPLQ